ncbi:hypothetical protein KDX38_09480 [Pseudomonas sp. CDFA 602]|uniref:hypothetical protein n=1 Tax=Pseudomonas californiensis TaxID=2829823 RepID=UPI001E3F814B|nr:hypothetical protein [Pseudomonas californiensis]MCD5993854.1 hypothetical protein [Pseudomonas californiensis]MCD5999449.1 hypothetical protein [Pseudomonas californiensis]
MSAKINDQPGATINLLKRALDADFTPEQKTIITELLTAERTHASRWWTHLNEMRLAQQLPAWCSGGDVGSRTDHERWLQDCSATTQELLGYRGHLSRFDPHYVHKVIDLHTNRCFSLENPSVRGKSGKRDDA